jgi:outer membrane lipopolysaccharide assembly protein LptE/RlpB
MQRPSIRYTVPVLGLLCLLSACGFALRGVGGTSLPEEWKAMHLSTNNPNGELSRELQSTFSAHDVAVRSAFANAICPLMPRPEPPNLNSQ